MEMKREIGGAALKMATSATARALAVTPLAVTQFHLNLAVERVLRRHPELVRRLPWSEEKRALILPSDLPVAFLVTRHGDRLVVTVSRKGRAPSADATIAGPIAAIIDMATGEDDGDALFFSRVVKVEGDVEVAVALRNAIDNADIDLFTEFLPAPLLKAPFVSAGVAMLRRLAAEFSPDYQPNYQSAQTMPEQNW